MSNKNFSRNVVLNWEGASCGKLDFFYLAVAVTFGQFNNM